MFLQGMGGQAFPDPEFWNAWSVVPKDWAESGTDKAAMGLPVITHCAAFRPFIYTQSTDLSLLAPKAHR